MAKAKEQPGVMDKKDTEKYEFNPHSIMTEEQEAHLMRIRKSFLVRLNDKYREGQKEHGGDLLDHPALWLLDNAISEAIDQLVYLLTLRESLVGDDER